MQDPSPQIFISYAKPDQAKVIPYVDALDKKGFNVWLDAKKLKPGQNWDFEIKRAFDKSSLIIAFISEESLGRRGYIQRELKLALDKLNEKLIDDIYIIPVLLDEGLAIPDQLKAIQCIAAQAPDCMQKMEDALTFQLGRLGLEVQRIQSQQEVVWSFHTVREEWDGLPGYEAELQSIRLESKKYPSIHEIGEFTYAQMLKTLFAARACKLAQAPDVHNFGQDRWSRTNTVDAHCGDPTIVGKVLTVQYAIHGYRAGAAHGNMDFATFSFVMDPLCLIEDLRSLFKDGVEQKALVAIRDYVRKELKATFVGDDEHKFPLDADWIDRGVGDWADFTTYIPKETGIEFLFAPYRVAAYACGPQFVLVPYEVIVEMMRSEYVSALGIGSIAYRLMRERKAKQGAQLNR